MSVTGTPLRIAIAEPVTFSTRPIGVADVALAAGLGVFGRRRLADDRVDDGARDGRAFSRGKGGALVVGEIVVDDDLPAVVADDQKILAGLPEVGVEQKRSVGDDRRPSEPASISRSAPSQKFSPRPWVGGSRRT